MDALLSRVWPVVVAVQLGVLLAALDGLGASATLLGLGATWFLPGGSPAAVAAAREEVPG